MIRLVVVDDQALMRVALRTLFDHEDDVRVVGEAGDGREGLDVIRRHRPDVVLCDIRMPVMDGLALLGHVARDPALTDVRVVMLTTFELDEYVFQALRHGASGFLLKDSDTDALVEAVRTVAAGGSLLAPSVTRHVIAHFAGGAASPPPRGLAELTAREAEIVGWVGTGRSNHEIADALVVSPDTVRTHVSRAMAKLGARDRTQLAVIAIENGMRPGETSGSA